MAKLVHLEEWKARQAELRRGMRVRPLRALPRFVAGVDCAFSRDKRFIYSVALVWDRLKDEVVDRCEIVRENDIPYVPGFLSFREGPAATAAVRGLKHPFGAALFDGQGYAHPRRCGFAAHLSVEMGLIGAGVAKSRLIGTHDTPGPLRGDSAPLLDEAEVIGTVLRTRDRTRPLYISVGNRIDLPSAERLVLACCTRYRIPEPTRLADRAVAALKKRDG
jgi:deoxyribonuclease V